MNGWPILDVAIGLAFVYLLLSMICTTLNEGILTQLRSRAKFLDQGILSLLGNSTELKREFFNHPLVKASRKTKGDSVPRRLLRTLGRKTVDADQCQSYLSSLVFAKTINDMMNRGLVEDGSTLAQSLRALLADTTDPEQRITLIEKWYDDAMDRVTGWYKRHAQAWVRVLAIIVTLAMNADTVKIARQLWQDPTQRQKVVDAAIERSKKPPKAANYKLDDSDTNETNEDGGSEFGSGTKQTVGAPSDGLTDREKEVLGELTGWSKEAKEREDLRGSDGKVSWGGEFQIAGMAISEHWLGWLITMIALSLGAPFWFDMLKRLINIRNAGIAPDEKKQKEAQNAA